MTRATMRASRRSAVLVGEELERSRSGLPAAPQTIDRLHHGVLDRISGISREFRSNSPNRVARDSSDHCSTN
jgi:hypothetical protein